MYVLNVSKKYHLKLTYKPPFLEPTELEIGQLWEYADPPDPDNPKKEIKPHWFQFVPKYLKEFDTRLTEDGRDNRKELLEIIKCNAHRLKRQGYIPHEAQMVFSMLAVESTF